MSNKKYTESLLGKKAYLINQRWGSLNDVKEVIVSGIIKKVDGDNLIFKLDNEEYGKDDYRYKNTYLSKKKAYNILKNLVSKDQKSIINSYVSKTKLEVAREEIGNLKDKLVGEKIVIRTSKKAKKYETTKITDVFPRTLYTKSHVDVCFLTKDGDGIYLLSRLGKNVLEYDRRIEIREKIKELELELKELDKKAELNPYPFGIKKTWEDLEVDLYPLLENNELIKFEEYLNSLYEDGFDTDTPFNKLKDKLKVDDESSLNLVK